MTKILPPIKSAPSLSPLQCSEWAEDNFRGVNKFYKRQKQKGSASGDERVFVVNTCDPITSDEHILIAAVRLVPYSGYYWLRSLYVAAPHQGKGIGSLLLAFVNEQVKQDIHCFPYTHLDRFYALSGYQLTQPAQLPMSLSQLFDRYNHKGDNIIAMSRIYAK